MACEGPIMFQMLQLAATVVPIMFQMVRLAATVVPLSPRLQPDYAVRVQGAASFPNQIVVFALTRPT